MKKVLVMDINGCGECSLCIKDKRNLNGIYLDYCILKNKEIIINDTIPLYCPLKTLPNKLSPPSYAHDSYYYYNKGYNDCLSEIENGK